MLALRVSNLRWSLALSDTLTLPQMFVLLTLLVINPPIVDTETSFVDCSNPGTQSQVSAHPLLQQATQRQWHYVRAIRSLRAPRSLCADQPLEWKAHRLGRSAADVVYESIFGRPQFPTAHSSSSVLS